MNNHSVIRFAWFIVVNSNTKWSVVVVADY